MKIKILLPILLTLALFTTGHAQTIDEANLISFLADLLKRTRRWEA
jgi:hypothetical protein